MRDADDNSSEFLYLAGQTVFEAAASLSEFDGRRPQETLNATLDGESLHVPQSPAFTHQRGNTPVNTTVNSSESRSAAFESPPTPAELISACGDLIGLCDA